MKRQTQRSPKDALLLSIGFIGAATALGAAIGAMWTHKKQQTAQAKRVQAAYDRLRQQMIQEEEEAC